MAIEKIERGMKLIKVLAAENRGERVDSDKIEEANQIISEMITDLSPNSMHLIGQTVAYTVEMLQEKALDFLGNVADTKNISYGEKAAFKVRHGGIKAVVQAKGATAPRSYVADSQILVETREIAARPAINVIDLRTGRVQMSDLIREANEAITEKKLKMAQQVLHAGISTYGSPFYAKSVGSLNQAALDAQLQHFRRFGPVSILGDTAIVSQLAAFTGMAVNPTSMQFSGNLIDERNNNGFIGMYNGCAVIGMTNAYDEDGITPILNPDWLYILPGGQTMEARNLKLVQEGGINSMSSQSIDDRTYEILLDTWFGAAFVTGKNPTSGAHELA